MQKSISAFGIGLLSMGSIAVPTIAGATTTECGPAEEGKTLTFSNGVCQAEYSVAGDYAFTVPSGATELAAITVGGGGSVGTGNNSYYAGDGGLVEYSDLSDPALVGTELSFIVGNGGTSSAPDPVDQSGGQSSIGNDSTVFSEATGGSVGYNYSKQCSLELNSDIEYGYEGWGAKGSPGYSDGDPCAEEGINGLNPSEDHPDSFGNLVPAIFQNYNATLGAGGYLTRSTSALTEGLGQGGSVRLNPADGSVVLQSEGSDGLVVFRWKVPVPAAPAALAETGSDSNQWNLAGAVGLLMLAAGAAFSTIAYRAKRKSN